MLFLFNYSSPSIPSFIGAPEHREFLSRDELREIQETPGVTVDVVVTTPPDEEYGTPGESQVTLRLGDESLTLFVFDAVRTDLPLWQQADSLAESWLALDEWRAECDYATLDVCGEEDAIGTF
jgi:hypothetical protein